MQGASLHTRKILTLINQTNLTTDVLLLPDFSSLSVNLLLNVLNAGFSKSSVNINEVEVYECAKILQINVKQSNSCIEAHNGTDVIEFKMT